MDAEPLDAADRTLVEAAREVIRRAYREERHTVGAAVRTTTGEVFTGVNIDTCGYGPCAEPIAIGAAVAAGHPDVACLVAVSGRTGDLPVLAPCGNCRQLLADYAPDARVILPGESGPAKVRAAALLPHAYQAFRNCTGASRPRA